VPEGFNVTLFAGEPDVQQPICMDFDDRGRLWVAENYTYSGGPYETKLRDRVVILEDKDGDGKHDSRKVFWDRGFMLTSLTWGFGGLWILHDGTLSFIPDRNGDDIPDGEPVVMLDGWSKDCGHNFVSGLIWGPDGWLYGRHGIVDTSYPGVPGTPKEERPFMNCGVWRFHPTKHLIEVVCHGTTNPWGLDYNEDGQFFMTNNVQGHLWHVIPGARYQRMYGQDFNPHSYELMDMTADHYHWDTKTKWTESRDGKANDFGGGHSHVGALIYLGNNFPAQYRGRIFMCNTHGRRINVNRLDREGSGYVGRREPDFMLVKNPWFRGVDIKMGPEGAMYVADWSDNGECHDHDGVHRTSGRIYRIIYTKPEQTFDDTTSITGNGAKLDLAKWDIFDPGMPNAANPFWGSNEWFRRKTARLVIEQALGTGAEAPGIRDRLVKACRAMIKEDEVRIPMMRAAWLLNSVDALDEESCSRLLLSRFEEVRALGVKLVADAPAGLQEKLRPILTGLLKLEQSLFVGMAYASALPKFRHEHRTDLAPELFEQLTRSSPMAVVMREDRNLQLVTWYGFLSIGKARSNYAEQAMVSPLLREFYYRKLASEWTLEGGEACRAMENQLEHVRTASEEVITLLRGVRKGLRGKSRVKAPANWDQTVEWITRDNNPIAIQLVSELSVLFGDGAAIADLRDLAGDGNMEAASREQAIATLVQARDAQSIPILFNLLGDRAVVSAAIKALAAFDHPETARQLLAKFDGFKGGNRGLAIDTMISRKPYALELVLAIGQGRLDARELTASQVRQLLAFGDDEIRAVLEAKWGVLNETPEARHAAIARWQKELTPETLANADLNNGAELFKKSCATCHKLYGEGKSIGPDLTGANRSNLEYLLMNIVDPSSVVPKQFTTSVIAMTDGRVITGVIVSETEQTLVVQTDKEQLTIARDDVEETKNTGKSLMPDGMLDPLTPEQVRDLFAFMMPRR
jgi:putative membrane-bound dehydrogenase-like protein